MSDDIADFVSMLIVQIYSKNSNVNQPLEDLADCARRNGKPSLATCLDEGVVSYLKIKRLLRNKTRQLRKFMASSKHRTPKHSNGKSATNAKYDTSNDKLLLAAYHTARNYETIAKTMLRDGLKNAKNQSLAPNTYYAMRNCIQKAKYHNIMRKKVASALKFKLCVQSAMPAHSSTFPQELSC